MTIDEATLAKWQRWITLGLPLTADEARILLAAYREQAVDVARLRAELAEAREKLEALKYHESMLTGCERGAATLRERLAKVEQERDAAQAQLAATRAALEDVVSVLADYRAAGVVFDDARVSYVEVQIPRVTVEDAEAVLARAAALLAPGGKEG